MSVSSANLLHAPLLIPRWKKTPVSLAKSPARMIEDSVVANVSASIVDSKPSPAAATTFGSPPAGSQVEGDAPLASNVASNHASSTLPPSPGLDDSSAGRWIEASKWWYRFGAQLCVR